jgi:hypothetical protein
LSVGAVISAADIDLLILRGVIDAAIAGFFDEQDWCVV